MVSGIDIFLLAPSILIRRECLQTSPTLSKLKRAFYSPWERDFRRDANLRNSPLNIALLQGPGALLFCAVHRLRQIVTHLVDNMSSPRAAGAIRAVSKLGTVKPMAADLFEDYRALVVDQSEQALSPMVKATSDDVRAGMQIVLATITDSVLRPESGILDAGSHEMQKALARTLLSFVSALGKVERTKAAKESYAGKSHAPTETIEVFDPDLRTMRRVTTTSVQQSRISDGRKKGR